MKIGIITEGKSDFSGILKNYAEVDYINPYQCGIVSLEEYDAICILGGRENDPLLLPAPLRVKVEEERAKNKRVFAEYVYSIGGHYSAPPEKTTYDRLVCISDEIEGLDVGCLLDDHYNNFTSPYYYFEGSRPLLVYGGHICSHDKCEIEKVEKVNHQKWGLWYLDDTTLICSFCISNFNKARLAPRENWLNVISYLVKWLTGSEWDRIIEPVCATGHVFDNFNEAVEECISRGIKWITDSKTLIDEGKGGVYEGFSHHIEPNGNQLTATPVRTDCSGEIAGAYLMDFLLTGNFNSKNIYNNIKTFIFENMQEKKGLHAGMIRWTTTAWEVCYQDDVARALIPFLLDFNLFNVDDKYEKEIISALDYLVKTTGKNGIRVSRTDIGFTNEESFNELNGSECDLKSAHYNAYYHAALLLAYHKTGKNEYLGTAQKGLSAIMEVFPDTIREQSETEELCRLIFPLSCLYEATHDELHKKWLYTVTYELEKHKHKSGGYCEWDTGYRASCARNENGECSLLTNNGDLIADLLYSVNWLPLGFSYAYHVTGDEYFKEKWEDVAKFFIRSQLHSSDKKINGSWARAYDLERDEIYGVPNDIGWGPCCIESGWTVAEIMIGLQFGRYIFSHNRK